MRRDMVCIRNVPEGIRYAHYKGQHEDGKYVATRLLAVVAPREEPLTAAQVEEFRKGTLKFEPTGEAA